MHIPFFFLANRIFSEPGDMVLDPFSGSGTVLLEAQLSGRLALGADCNPLARLLSKVKTSPIPSGVLKRALVRLLERTPAKPSYPPPDVVNMAHWFLPETVEQLQCLREGIWRTRNIAIRDFFDIAFSSCLRKVSLADPRLIVPVRLRNEKRPHF